MQVSLVGARYPHSNVRLILSKLDDVIPADSIKKLMARFMGEDGEADAGTVHERMFRTILRDFIGYELRDGQCLCDVHNQGGGSPMHRGLVRGRKKREKGWIYTSCPCPMADDRAEKLRE